MSNKSISILGCGWLGFPFAKRLVSRGYKVKGSTTSREKFSAIDSAQIKPYIIQCDPEISGDHISDFFESEILLINIPYRRSLENPSVYRDQIFSIIPHICTSAVQRVLFASSTSVYPSNIDIAYEDIKISPNQLRSRILLEIEDELSKNKHFQSTIVRFAGMYGQERKIGKFMAGKKNIANGQSPVNLIHLEDCQLVLETIIEKHAWNEIFNACSDGHPSRKDIYTLAAQKQGSKLPEFAQDDQPPTKIVSNKKIKECLGVSFKYPDPYEFVKSL